ncbi:MAG: aromatic ring-hydroxylating dioxygenase subunit alpha [Leptolyngbyaceae cyanobacterium SL_7_1]|nr:aromatic ring-hydroxylating dioxygenase subunit alpha [Leptolyngbyaceae cyanobacterium SL_7_1]
MNALLTSELRVFNQPDRFVEGWYWLLPSHQLKRGQVKAVQLLGRSLAVYRGQDGRAIAVDAYCPHMGAHLAEGKVEGCALRCLFHNWKFAATGECVDVPALGKPVPVRLHLWHTAEQYGMIWLWTGEFPTQPPPFVPELEGIECDSALGTHFVHNCHPNVVMINAIDAHHFNTVHHLPLEIVFSAKELNPNAIEFSNTTRGGDSRFIRLIRPFYQTAVTYSLCYWYGTVGTVTLGPDRLHFYILFALRLLEGGKTEGQTLLITPKRSGIHGWLGNRLLLWLTQQVAHYFGKGDTRIFQTIQFNFKTPTKADHSIAQFIQHVEQQKILSWETWHEIN